MLKQSLQQKLLQKLSPQQIQLMKLLQVPTVELEQRIKEESLFSKFIKDVSRYDEHEVPQPTMRVVEDINPNEVEEIFTNNNWA